MTCCSFQALDGDGSGLVGFEELQAWARGRKTREAIKREKMAALSTGGLADRVVEEEEAWDELRLHKELKALLAAQASS